MISFSQPQSLILLKQANDDTVAPRLKHEPETEMEFQLRGRFFLDLFDSAPPRFSLMCN